MKTTLRMPYALGTHFKMILILCNLQMPVETFRICQNILVIKYMYLLHLLKYSLLVLILARETQYLAAGNNIYGIAYAHNMARNISFCSGENNKWCGAYHIVYASDVQLYPCTVYKLKIKDTTGSYRLCTFHWFNRDRISPSNYGSIGGTVIRIKMLK
eukprot:UN12797